MICRTHVIGILILVFISGCASARKSKSQVDPRSGAEYPRAKPSLGELLSTSNDQQILDNSEFTITLPHEEDPAIKKFSAAADHMKYQGSAFSCKKQVKGGKLNARTYHELINRFRQLDESDFKATATQTTCKEPYSVKIRIGTDERVFTGCRDGGVNARTISRIARDLEFQLIKGEFVDGG